MNKHNTVPAKIAIFHERSLDHGLWLARATLLLLGSVLIYGLLCAPANADEARPTAHIANIYGGFDHQPTRTEIERRERAAGLAPSTPRQSSEDATLQQLYQQLRESAGTG